MSMENSELTPETQANMGQIETGEDGRTSVVFERLLAYSVETVWAAITDPEQLANWFPGLKLELKQGGSFELRFIGSDICEDAPAHLSGIVTRFDPPRLLAYGTMQWELSPTHQGCLLRFTDIPEYTSSRAQQETNNSILGGWHRYMNWLEDGLAGRPINFEQAEVDYNAIDITFTAPKAQ